MLQTEYKGGPRPKNVDFFHQKYPAIYAILITKKKKKKKMKYWHICKHYLII